MYCLMKLVFPSCVCVCVLDHNKNVLLRVMAQDPQIESHCSASVTFKNDVKPCSFLYVQCLM